MSRSYIPLRRRAASLERNGELVVWAAGAPSPVRLDPVESLIFQIVDGVADVDMLVEDVCDSVDGIPPAVARARITDALDLFECHGLLATSIEPQARRDLIFPYSTST